MSASDAQDEFERSFLAKEIPPRALESRSKEVHDIYFPHDEPHCKLRLRKIGEKFEMTKKETAAGTDSSHLIEYTIPLTKAEFLALRDVKGKEVRKVRYYYEADGVTYEIGVFQDALEGLVIVDVEFKSREELESFVMPDWLLADVTQEGFLAGGELCGKSYGDIAPGLAAYGYARISTP